VEGAAVSIGQDIVLTNAAGEFFLRRKNATVVSLQAVLGEFLNPASFRVVSAPATAIPALDSGASEIIVILTSN
jgi:hypothetical protein